MNDIKIIEKFRDFNERFKKIPMIKILSGEFDRTNPLFLVFILAGVCICVGIFISFLEILIWIGGLVVLIYIIYLIIYLKDKF